MERILVVEANDSPPRQNIEVLTKLLGEFESCNLPKDSVYARLLHRLGDLYRLTGDFNNGISFTMRALSVNRRPTASTSQSFLTNSYYNLGLYYALLSEFERSNSYFDSCITVGSQFPGKASIVLMAFEQKCFNFFNMGEYQNAIDAADYGILVAKENNDLGYEGVLLQQKAQSELSMQYVSEAEKNGEMAIKILQKSDMPREYLASAYSTYARVMLSRNHPSSAIDFYERSILQNRESANWVQCAKDYMDLGYLYDYTLHKTGEAVACYHKGLEILKDDPDPYQRLALLTNLGVAHWRNGNLRGALKCYQQGLNALPIGFKDTSVVENPPLFSLKSISHDYFVGALFENKGDALLQLYKLGGKKDLLKAALHAYKCADKIVDHMRWKQTRETSKLYWRQKTRKLYEHAIETCYLLNSVEDGFFFMEKSRAVLLNDKLNELGAQKVLSSEDSKREREMRSKLAALQASFATSKDKPNLEEEWYKGRQQLDEYTHQLERKYPLYFYYKRDTTSYTVEDLRKILLKENETYVEYFTADSVIYALKIGGDKPSFIKKEVPQLQGLLDQYRNFCSSPGALNGDYKSFLTVSNGLYQILFRDLGISTARVVVSLDDYFIPFEALVKAKGQPRSFLLVDHVFRYVYSASYMLRNQKQHLLQNSMLAVAPVWYSPALNLSPLRGAEVSLKRIQSQFHESVALTNEAATKEAFISKLPEYSIVHVYSHAMADYSQEEPVLFFHDDAIKLRDLQLLPEVKTQLLVLSGCRTGIGRSVKGEGVLSLARGFAAAGIPSTITTLWSVDDKVTYRIMEGFYSYMKEGFSSDEALQKAKIDFLNESDGENELPYYWASTVVLGENLRMEQRFLSDKLVKIFFFTIAFLSIGAFLLRRRVFLRS